MEHTLSTVHAPKLAPQHAKIIAPQWRRLSGSIHLRQEPLEDLVAQQLAAHGEPHDIAASFQQPKRKCIAQALSEYVEKFNAEAFRERGKRDTLHQPQA